MSDLLRVNRDGTSLSCTFLSRLCPSRSRQLALETVWAHFLAKQPPTDVELLGVEKEIEAGADGRASRVVFRMAEAVVASVDDVSTGVVTMATRQ